MFERLSHFKDAGVPGTSGPTPTDAFNRAAIADGSCRMVGTEGDVALAFLHPRRADAVVAALAALPSTSQPSLFTRTAVSSLPDTCRGPPGNETVGLESFGVTAVAGSLQNWFRALCDPNWDDPAYMPQQQLLTFGFSCTPPLLPPIVPLSGACLDSPLSPPSHVLLFLSGHPRRHDPPPRRGR